MSASRQRVRVGVLGCGAVTRLYHANALESLARAGEIDVRVLADPDQTALATLHARFPAATAIANADVAALVGAIDLAIVASPTRLHAEHTIALLRAGVAVLCEKPLARTATEGEAMVAAADESRRVLAAGMIRRHLPATAAIRSILRARMLGAVRRFTCHEGGVFRWPSAAPSFFDRSNGGVMLDVGVHVVDLLMWWLDEPAAVVYADDAMGGVEANARLQLTYADGCAGEVRLSRDWKTPNTYAFECEHGSLRWHVHEPTRISLELSDSRHALAAELRELTRDHSEGAAARGFEASFETQLRNVVAAMRGEEAPVVSGRDALAGLRLIDRCLGARTLLPMPWLDEREMANAHRMRRATP